VWGWEEFCVFGLRWFFFFCVFVNFCLLFFFFFCLVLFCLFFLFVYLSMGGGGGGGGGEKITGCSVQWGAHPVGKNNVK